jgi:nucleotide-binding universal stress UspA family protein
MFTRILCGVDETPEAIEAVRQARRLSLPETELLLVDVLDMNAAVHAGWAATEVLFDMRNEQLAALEVARVAAGDHVETRLIRGVPWSEIAGTAREENVDLVAVGTHDRRRPAGIVGGSVCTYVLHGAPCSVLIARSCGEPELFPRSIVAGFDGSRTPPEQRSRSRGRSRTGRRRLSASSPQPAERSFRSIRSANTLQTRTSITDRHWMPS